MAKSYGKILAAKVCVWGELYPDIGDILRRRNGDSSAQTKVNPVAKSLYREFIEGISKPQYIVYI
jgi:hypothetical protein